MSTASVPPLDRARDLIARLPGRIAGRVSLGVSPEARALEGACASTGLPEVDSLTGGGFPRGRLTEIVGRGPSGKLSLVLAALRAALARGELAALVDLTGTTCPGEAWAAGRLLVLRPRTLPEALRVADVLVESAAFSLVALEASGAVGLRALVPEPLQVRLSRLAREGGTAFVACADRPLLGPLAALRLEARPRPGGAFAVAVRKSRAGATGTAAVPGPGGGMSSIEENGSAA